MIPSRRSSSASRAAIAVALLAVLAGACANGSEVAAPVELFVLGVAQDGGLPHLGCEAPCCADARATGRVEDPACLGLVDRRGDAEKLLLVEATPAVERQVARLHALAGVEDRGRRPVDALLVTHAHIGHYLGLAHFGREVAASRRLPVWCSQRFAAFLRQNAPWRQLVELEQLDVRAFAIGEPFAPWPGVEVTALAVPHRDEFSDTVAYRIRGPNRTVLFAPDIDAWERAPGLLARLLDGVDVAYVDGTFFDGSELPDRALDEIPHPLMVRTMQRLADVARARPGAIRFVHLNHTNPALSDDALRAHVEAMGFAVARTGERVPL